MDVKETSGDTILNQEDDIALSKYKNSLRNRHQTDKNRFPTTAIDSDTYRRMSGSTGSTTVTGSKLAQEIHDEFLTCKICLEPYKSPKCLDCLHTFCEQCIENHIMSECTYKKYADYRDFTCPLCRKHTQLPVGGVKKLPDNFLVSSLSEIVAKQRPSKFPFCDICKLINHKHREASSKCLDCNKLLCKSCVEIHRETKVTKTHSLFDVEIEKEVECKAHPEEAVRFYCEPCEACICVLCTFNEHKDHEITQFIEAVNKYKDTIQSLLNVCKEKIRVFDEQLVTLGKCETLIKDSEQRIRDAAIQFISDIRTKERLLIEELHQAYGEELISYVTRKNEMQVNLDSLKSTCSLTELVLKGKDMELLLLKKQVQQKLSHLSDVKLKELPETISKQITFFVGTLQLGELHDLSKPGTKGGNPKNMRTASCNDESYGESNAMTSTSVQTDKKMADFAVKTSNSVAVQTDKPPPPTNQVLFPPATDVDPNVSFTFAPPADSSDEVGGDVAQLSQPPVTRVMSEDDGIDSTSGSPSVIRRQRRRRQRPERVEVSARPTTLAEYGEISAHKKQGW